MTDTGWIWFFLIDPYPDRGQGPRDSSSELGSRTRSEFRSGLERIDSGWVGSRVVCRATGVRSNSDVGPDLLDRRPDPDSNHLPEPTGSREFVMLLSESDTTEDEKGR